MSALTPIDDAHAKLLRNDQLQFDFSPPRPPPEPPPEWHGWFATHAVTVVWVIVGLTALFVAVLTWNYLRKQPRGAPVDAPPALAPEVAIPVAAARLALVDADRLAAGNRFLEAAHVLLACGVNAIGRGYPGALRPASTSRDIAATRDLPEPIRRAFGRIAAAVEIGLFGGRAVDASDYAECRRVFVASALAHAD